MDLDSLFTNVLLLLMEAVPLVLPGHNQEIECLVSDGDTIVSTCLRGTIKIWDAQSGENLNNIDRHLYFKHHMEENQEGSNDKKKCEHSPHTCSHLMENHTETHQQASQQLLVSSSSFANTSNSMPTLKKTLQGPWSFVDTGTLESTDTNRYDTTTKVENARYKFAKSYRNFYIYPNQDCAQIENKENNEGFDKITKTLHPVLNGVKQESKHSIMSDLSKDKVDNDLPNRKSEVSHGGYEYSYKENSNLRNRNHKQHISSNDGQEIKLVSNISAENDDLNVNSFLLDTVSLNINEPPPVWCMDFCNNLIVLGCGDGRLEFWESISGKLICKFEEESVSDSSTGVTHVRVVGGGRATVAARLTGHLEVFRLSACDAPGRNLVDWNFSAAYRRTHVRTGSAGSIPSNAMPYEVQKNSSIGMHRNQEQVSSEFNSFEDLTEYNGKVYCGRIAFTRAHLQPVTVMQCEGGRILSGGQDHVLKVHGCMDLTPLYTLHGHCGPITSSFIDRVKPTIGGSGSQDGLLCVWDLNTGACLYSLQAHDGSVTSLAYTPSYVMSSGADERLRIWDRFQGHLLKTIHIGLSYACNMLPLTHSLLIIGDRNGLTVWDVTSGDAIRRVILGKNDGCIFVRQILPLKDAVVCDYGNQLRIIRFPLVSKISKEASKNK